MILKLLILLLSILFNGFLLGLKANSKGYLEGIKYGIFLIILLFIPSIFLSSIQPKLVIYYFIILITSMLGSIIGISQKKES